MRLRHATTRQNLESIRRQGLLLDYADPQAKIKGVWLHTPSRSLWALAHTQRKHRATLDEVVFLTVTVPRKYLRQFKNSTTGYSAWYSIRNIPAKSIKVDIITGAELAAGIAE